MLQQTKAIILRIVPYGDTSLIVSAFTERYGIQQYMVKGARKASRKGSSQSSFLQPGALLDLVVYHNELKQLQIIREMKWAWVYTQVMANISRNAIALYMVELLSKCLRQPETNADLFAFAEQHLLLLDQCDNAVAANLPLYFTLQLAAQLGFRIEDEYNEAHPYLDLREGQFVPEPPIHGMYTDPRLSALTHELLQQENAITLYRLKMHHQQRRELLQAYAHFFHYHISDFGQLKTLQVLQEVLG
ncbi:MAG: DNA repair protein RecO [Chitinophagaceae bacterium]|nr:DNA repair protein RecO [Chitinophagaceae bacterium]